MPIILWSINIKILWRKKRFNIIYCTVDLCVEIQQGPIYQSLFYSYAIWATDMLRFRNFYTSICIFLIIELASKVHWMSMKIYFDIPALHFSPINQSINQSIRHSNDRSIKPQSAWQLGKYLSGMMSRVAMKMSTWKSAMASKNSADRNWVM